MDIKAILLDFDGTTLQKDQTFISFRNMHALKQAIARGIEVIPCTGRSEAMFPPQIETETQIRYWVTSSGARVVDRDTKDVIYESLFTPEEAAELCRIFEKQSVYSEIAANGLIYMEKEVCRHLENYAVPPHHVWFLDRNLQVEIETPSEYFLSHQIGVEKFNLYGIPADKQEQILTAIEATGLVHITEGAGADIQFFPRRLSRKLAVDALFAKLGLSFDHVLSIGDSGMDEPVIVEAAIGVAVGNAPDWLKAKADYVVAPFYEDGVAEAIETYLL
ncbi:MAG: HAD hydrolase family protein [Lachnospiraceae bacterium]